MTGVKVSDVMTSKVATIREDTSFRDIVDVLIARDVSGLPVVDDDGRLVGLVSEGDLVVKQSETGAEPPRLIATLRDMFTPEGRRRQAKAEGITAADVMSRTVVTARPDESLHAAARRMLDKGVNRLPVVEDDRLVGIVTRHDVLRPYARSDRELTRDVDQQLKGALFVLPEHAVTVTVLGGRANLRGTVRFTSDIRVAEALTRAVDGVVDVDNDLVATLPDPAPYPAHAYPTHAPY